MVRKMAGRRSAPSRGVAEKSNPQVRGVALTVVQLAPGERADLVVDFASSGFPGRYVWHCHILEHEDNEMMRPYEILPAGAA